MLKSDLGDVNFRQYTKFNQLRQDIFNVRYLPNLQFVKENGLNQTFSSIPGTQITIESVFKSRFTLNNIVPKLQKCWTHDYLQNHIKNAKATKFFDNQPSAVPEEALACKVRSGMLSTKFHLHGLSAKT